MATDPSAAQGIVVPPGGFTVEDLDAWPESHVRRELTDGALTVSPSPSSLHQIVAGLFFAYLFARTPEHLVATQAVEIRFTRRTTRIPDVLVVESEEPGRHWFAPAEVVLAVEMESPGSITDDRVTKPAIYARHGIPHFWRIELDPVVVHVYRLEDDVYREVATIKADERLVLDEPFPIDVAVSDLLPRWAR